MLYNCSQPLDKENFLARANLLASRGDVVELSTKRQRTYRQNAYLHVLLEYFGCQYGETAEFVKREYFKILVNPHIFIREKQDRFRGNIRILRSTADLSTEEMSICIDRFRNWASQEAGIYLPTAEEGMMIRQMEVEISKHSRFI